MSEPVQQLVRCPQCDANNESHAQFCHACGESMTTSRRKGRRFSGTLLVLMILGIAAILAMFAMARSNHVPGRYERKNKHSAGSSGVFQDQFCNRTAVNSVALFD